MGKVITTDDVFFILVKKELLGMIPRDKYKRLSIKLDEWINQEIEIMAGETNE